MKPIATRQPNNPPHHQRPRRAHSLAVRYRPIDRLRADPKNPRIHSRIQVSKIAKSIENFGFISPLLVDERGSVIAGHGRLLAAKHLGWSEVPTIELRHLSPAQVQAYRIADNRLTECSSWDDQLLAEQLRDLAAVELDFDLEVTGFETTEIDLMIEGLAAAEPPGEPDPADALPEILGPPVSRPGDLWLLGPHKLLCGSALEDEDYQTLMGDAKASVVFADPPYNVPISGHVGGLGAIQHREFAMASGEMDSGEFTAFLARALKHLAAASRPGALHYLCMDWRHLSELLVAGRAAYEALLNLCVWVKGNGGMGSLYRSEHEMILVYKHGRAKHRNNVQLGQYGRYRTNVWRYPGANSFARKSEEGNLLTLHPTVKPVALVADALLDASKRGEIVLDPFLGSGTTLMAAERTGRVCYAMELDPGYADVAIRRWEAYTGGVAKHAHRRRRFRTLAAERGRAHGKKIQ